MFCCVFLSYDCVFLFLYVLPTGVIINNNKQQKGKCNALMKLCLVTAAERHGELSVSGRTGE